MRIIAVCAIWILTLSEVSAGVIINTISVAAGIYSQEGNGFAQNSDTYAGEDFGIPVNSGVSDLNYPFYANTSRVAYDFQQHGQDATIDFDWDHTIAGVTKDEAYGYASMEFTPDVNMRYVLSGTYSVSGDAAAHQITEFGGYVDSLSIHSYKVSRSTPNETLVVGSLLGGDFTNDVDGNFTGELLAGHEYWINNIWYLRADSDSAPSVSTGNLRLTLSPLNAAAVPEPSSLLLLGMGAFGYLVHGRRGRQKRSHSC